MNRSSGRPERSRRSALPELHFAAWGFGLNGVWEALQSPLYVDHVRGLDYVVRTRLHCTLVDTLLVVAAFWITSALRRDRRWWSSPSGMSVVVFVAIGLIFTIGSEWLATRVRFAWEYTPAMPLVFGLGLSPVLQWILVPPAVLALVRKTCKAGQESP